MTTNSEHTEKIGQTNEVENCGKRTRIEYFLVAYHHYEYVTLHIYKYFIGDDTIQMTF